MATRLSTVLALVALFVAAATQSITPTNETTSSPPFVLIAGPKMQDKAGDLEALTTSAFSSAPHGLTGALYLATVENASNLTMGHIAFVTCDTDVYPGNLQAVDVVNTVLSKNASAVLLYSTTSETCAIKNDPSLNSAVIYAMIDKTAAQSLLSQLENNPTSFMFLVNVAHQGSVQTNNSTTANGNNNGNSASSNSPLGPSPSTAVAMIILYSITGVITALFLVIIITGAIRAHRNPERYGPRDVLGRPRQSRAKGLARAMLDSIPIVKFGENEAPKPTDVELGPQQAGQGTEAHNAVATPAVRDNTSADEPAATASDNNRSLPEGIAPAQTTTSAPNDTASDSYALGCTICTDDFEVGQDIRVLPCNHKFHPACVDPWLLNVSGTCPLCRIDLRPTTSRGSVDGGENEARRSNSFAPPLEEPAHSVDQLNAPQQHSRDPNRRRSRLVSIFAPDRLNNSTVEERLEALRRLRERNAHNGSETASTEDPQTVDAAGVDAGGHDVRRTRRLTMRLQDVFGVRTRRQGERDLPASTSGSFNER